MITVTGTRENYIAEMTADRGTLNATHCDIPVEQGGDNAYMRPGETLLSALGACMNITARKYLLKIMKNPAIAESGDRDKLRLLVPVQGVMGESGFRENLREPVKSVSHVCRAVGIAADGDDLAA